MTKPKKQEIVKANALIEASYRLSVAEQRIILACIAQARQGQPLTDEVTYTVTATQYAELAGTNSKNAYQELEEAALRLFERRVMFYAAPNGKGALKARLTRWVQEVAYYDNKGQLGLRFATALIPYLCQLTEQFTRYTLSDVARMSSSHAIRLYELLVQWESAGEREIPLSWLQERLGIQGKYPAFAGFRRRVIEIAIKQINELSPITVTWRPVKTGRKVTALHFEFKRKRGKAKRAAASGKLTHEEIKRLAKPGETYEQAAQRIKRERAWH